MEHAVRSLFLVASFDDGSHCVAIYEIEIGGGVAAEFIGPPVKAFTFTEERYFVPVGCGIAGSQIFLMASAMPASGHKITQLLPLVFNTETKELTDVPEPKAEKPFAKVMAVDGSFFVLAADTACSGFSIRSPSFERFDPRNWAWDSSNLPEYRVPEESNMGVVGYAVIHDNILISVVGLSSPQTAQFFFYKVGSSMEKWQEVEKENQGVLYHSFSGKSEYVDEYVYTFIEHCFLLAYHVTISNDDGIIQSISAPRTIIGLDYYPGQLYTSCFVYLGNGKFCVARTECTDVQHLSIFTVEIMESINAIISSSDVLPLNTEDLGQANLESLCVDLQFNEGLSSKELKVEGLKDRSEYFEDLYADTHLQPINTDPPKLESVSEASQPARKRVVAQPQFLGKELRKMLQSYCFPIFKILLLSFILLLLQRMRFYFC